jgi:lysophospholipase L1-like esterase
VITTALGGGVVIVAIFADEIVLGEPGFGLKQSAMFVFGLVVLLAPSLGQWIKSKMAMTIRMSSLFIITIITIAMAEIIFGLLYEYITPHPGRIAVDILREKLDPNKAKAIQRHPYMLYGNTPGREADGFRQINSMGYRGHEITLQPEPGVIRVLAIGGSTTFGYGVKDPSQSWPAQLENILNQEAKKVEVVNGGLNYATSAELLTHYLFRDRYLGARIVIIHTGGNDIGPLALGNYTPEYTHWRSGWSSSLLQLRWGEKLLLKSNISKVFYAWWLKDRGSMKTYLSTQPVETYTPEVVRLNVEMNEPIGFQRNLDLLVRNIIEDGVQLVVFPFAMASKAVYENAEANARFRPYHDAMELGLAKNHQVMQEIANTYSIPLIEIPEGVIPLESFVDHCHLNEIGQHIKAQYIADKIKPLLNKIVP